MKFNRKKQLTIQQRELVHQEVAKEYERIMQQHESKTVGSLLLFVQIALCTTLQEQLGFGVEKRIPKFLNAFIENMNSFSKDLHNNVAEYNRDGRMVTDFDIEGNRENIRKACEYFKIHYDESVFEDFERV